MSQQTNDFQQLTDCIHRLFDNKNAKFTHSALIPTIAGCAHREIDILVEYNENNKNKKIAIETKDFKKSLSVTDIETYIGKYASPGGISVNAVIIVAHKFSKGAISRIQEFNRLQKLNIHFNLKTLNELSNCPVDSLFSDQPEEMDKGWGIFYEKDNAVRIKLVDTNGKEIKCNLLQTWLWARNLNCKIDTIASYCNMLLKFFIGQEANKVYGLNKGTSVKVIIELKIQNFDVLNKNKIIPLDKIIFIFPEQLRFPQMHSCIKEIKTIDGECRQIVEEIGENKENKLRIIHEDQNKLYVQYIEKNSKKHCFLSIFCVNIILSNLY